MNNFLFSNPGLSSGGVSILRCGAGLPLPFASEDAALLAGLSRLGVIYELSKF